MKHGKYSSPVIKDEYSGVRNTVLFNKHPLRKNNHVVAAMYAMYNSKYPETGKKRSLEQVAKAYRKTRQAVYDTFRTRGYKLRAKELKGLTLIDGFRFTEMKGGYLRGTADGKRILAHQYIWEKERGVLSKEFVIHHIDGDPKNNSIENLELVHRKDMQKKFNPHGNNQFTKKV